jgi:hypothetical protein
MGLGQSYHETSIERFCKIVQMIPMLILIDRNGKIIGRWKSASNESEQSMDKLLSQIFDNL